MVVFQRRSLRPVRQSPFHPSWGFPRVKRWQPPLGGPANPPDRRCPAGRDAMSMELSLTMRRHLTFTTCAWQRNRSSAFRLEAGKIVFVMALGARPVLGDEEA